MSKIPLFFQIGPIKDAINKVFLESGKDATQCEMTIDFEKNQICVYAINGLPQFIDIQPEWVHLLRRELSMRQK